MQLSTTFRGLNQRDSAQVVDGEDIHAQCEGHDLPATVTTACERLRSQLVKRRRRRETNRQK